MTHPYAIIRTGSRAGVVATSQSYHHAHARARAFARVLQDPVAVIATQNPMDQVVGSTAYCYREGKLHMGNLKPDCVGAWVVPNLMGKWNEVVS